MLSIDDASRALTRSLLAAPGGFAWWYVDLVDSSGTGLVAIWSWGLPFLPGYTDSARRGAAPPAVQRPSLNLCVYERGAPSFYMLQEYAPNDVSWGDQEWTFGASRLVHKISGDTLELHAQFDTSIAGSARRLTGELEVSGPRVHGLKGEGAESHGHLWTPLITAASGRASFSYEGRNVAVEGRGYHDRNGSEVHLDGLGIRDWIWARVPHGEKELIVYLVYGEESATTHVIVVEPSGFAQELEAEVSVGTEVAGWFGMRWPRSLCIRFADRETVTLRIEALVDDGPFYLRFLVRNGEQMGVGERIHPARIDRPSFRPLVKMAVHDTAGANSFWLPLFSGPRHTRLRRLLGQLGGRR